MIKHHVTIYGEGGKLYAEAWLQVNAFGKCFCFWKQRIEIGVYE